MRDPVTKTVQVRFGRGIRNDWQTRDVFDFAWDSGTLTLTDSQVRDLSDDLHHYSDPRSSDMEPSTRQLYVRARNTLVQAARTYAES